MPCFPFLALCLGEGLKCHICSSSKSWDNCEKKAAKASCPLGHSEVCIKLHVVEHSEDTNGHKETFIKMCGKAKMCTDKECKMHGKYCKVDCCHSDYCNTAARPTPGLPIILFQLSVLILLYLLQLACFFS